jgi:hypothetical protein
MQFTGMFRRHSGNGKSVSDYDIGKFLDLASVPGLFQKNLKTGKNPNVFIEKQQYKVAMAGRASRFKSEIVRERRYNKKEFFFFFWIRLTPHWETFFARSFKIGRRFTSTLIFLLFVDVHSENVCPLLGIEPTPHVVFADDGTYGSSASQRLNQLSYVTQKEFY